MTGFPRKGSIIHTHLYPMKRRDFLYSAGAAATLPVLPLPAAAPPVVAAPVHTAKVGWAALYARTHAKASPALIQKWLGVGPQQAHALMTELTRINIIHAPVGGTALAVDPIYTARSVPGLQSAGLRMREQARKAVRAWVEDSPEVQVTDTIEEPDHETS